MFQYKRVLGDLRVSDIEANRSICVIDGWMVDLEILRPFNSISITSERSLDDNERLCTMELRLRLRRFHLE